MDRALAASLGAAARQARARAGLTQADVAEQIEISPEVYGRLERGQMLPSVVTLRKLALALGTRSDSLLGLERPLPLPQVAEPRASYGMDKELRKLIRRARRLRSSQLRLLSLLAAQLWERRPRPHQVQGRP